MSETAACLRTANLTGALAAAKAEVRDNPSEAAPRVALFQLLCSLTQWDAAETQLRVLAGLDPSSQIFAQAYQILVSAERTRERVWAGSETPILTGTPEPWLAVLVEANRALARNEAVAGGRLRDEAFAAAAATSGTIDGKEFSWLADSDNRLGPVLEAVFDGLYRWVPIHHLANLRISPPTDLRDLVWVSAEWTWTNGGTSCGFLPVRYPGLTADSDPMHLLSRATDWIESDGDWSLGRGQKVLATDVGEFALLDIREIVFSHEVTGEDHA